MNEYIWRQLWYPETILGAQTNALLLLLVFCLPKMSPPNIAPPLCPKCLHFKFLYQKCIHQKCLQVLLSEELIIAVNGPSVEHCDSVCRKALQHCYQNAKHQQDTEGRFVRRSAKMAQFTVSKAVDKLREQKPKKSIMM